tara:strand:+ start:399 stop:596 length:198 start_codon:yes stop_codon:yes gene_type:complete
LSNLGTLATQRKNRGKKKKIKFFELIVDLISEVLKDKLIIDVNNIPIPNLKSGAVKNQKSISDKE